MPKFECEKCKASFLRGALECDGFDQCADCLGLCLICNERLLKGEVKFCKECCDEYNITRGKVCQRIR